MFLKKFKKSELGVELELEGYTNCVFTKDYFPRKLRKKYIYDITVDPSVNDSGTEIVFKYFPLSNWKYNDIVEIYKILFSMNLHQGKSAGMHIHYSGPDIMIVYNSYKMESDFIINNKCDGFLTNCLKTIGARSGDSMYGLSDNILKPSFKDDYTFETKVFESTMNPYIFYYRLHVTQYIMDVMSKFEYSEIPNVFFYKMPNNVKEMFWFLTTTENPNKYGFKRDFVYTKLSEKPKPLQHHR